MTIQGTSKKVLEFIIKFREQKRYYPNRKQIGEALGMTYTTAHTTVGTLVDTGYLDVSDEDKSPIIEARMTPIVRDSKSRKTK